MNFRIRKALAQDAEKCAQIHIQAWQESYRGIIPDSYLDSADLTKRISMWKNIIQDQSLLNFVAEIEDIGVVGYVTAGANRSSQFEGHGEVIGIYLLKEYHRYGIGKALFHTAFQFLKTNGFTKIALWVLKDNPTCTFYSKMKGNKSGEQEIEIAGKKLVEIAYCWNSIETWPIYHITSMAEWKNAKSLGYYTHSSLKKDGFIHLSEIHQVHRIANCWYKEIIDPIVLEVDPLKLNVPLKYESGGGEEEFPHIYGVINLEAITQIRELKKNSEGFFESLI